LEIDDDTVSVMDGSRIASRFREIKLEPLRPEGEALLNPILERLSRAGALVGDRRPKVMRALGRRANEPPDVTVVELGPTSSVGEFVSASIAGGYRRLVEHDAGIRLGEDPEDLHQAQVAKRRLRSDLRTMRELLERDWLITVRRELGWLAHALGKVRDSDVLAQRMIGHVSQLASEDQLGAVPLLRRLKAECAAARRELTVAMDSERYVNLLKMLARAAKNPPLAQLPNAGSRALEERAATEVIPRIVRDPWRRLSRTVAALGALPTDDDLHRVRIAAKKLRYTCEAVAPVIGGQSKRLAQDAAALQEALGDHHDAVCAERWLREEARFSSRATAVVIGQLIAVERVAQRTGRAQWPERWRRLKAKKNTSWIEGHLR